MSKKIRVALIGIGNCASALVQGVHFYKDIRSDQQDIPGVMHVELGGYHINDMEFVAAFDVNATKVGEDLAKAIFAYPNNAEKFVAVPDTGVLVDKGPVMDGLGAYPKELIVISPKNASNVVQILHNMAVDVCVNFLPVGSEHAAKWYALQAISAGCGFVNCMPVFMASNSEWGHNFHVAGLPIIGDDVKSQVGATIVHRVLTNLFEDRGVRLDRTYQLNVGGNMDFYNMLERDRLESKRISKTQAVTSMLAHKMQPTDIHIGPSDYVPWLEDRKFCYIQMEGTTFGNLSLKVEVKLEVQDSPNSAGVVIDAIRCCKLALDRGLSGAIKEPSAYFMKSPPEQYTDDEARQLLESWIGA